MQASAHIQKSEKTAFYGVALVNMIFMALALWTQQYAIALVPIGLVFAAVTILDIRFPYYAFFAIIPFSIEVYLGSFGTDLPSEPLMLLLTGIAILLAIGKWRDIDGRYIVHPISLLMLAHIGWIVFSAILSAEVVISFKFLLAKLWYVIPFYGLTFYMIKETADLRRVMKILILMLSIAVSIVVFRHALVGFDFNMYNKVVQPIFRNHVNYASMQVILLPFVWALMRTARSAHHRNIWIAVIILFFIGINFSYTRAAQGCIFLAVVYYMVIRMKLLKVALSAAMIGIIFLSSYMVYKNKYMDFAPNFEKTITHRSYDNLIDATIKLEDISTMERVYRWVAGGYMISERPLVGFGPGSFYNHYKGYTVTDFKTYVSDNPEKSGIHNYYLMLFIEQGIFGLLIYLGLLFVTLLKGEAVYARLKDKKDKAWLMASLLCIFIISTLQLMNDLLESDKIGPFFFLSMALIVFYDLKSRRIEDSRNTDR